MQTWIEYVRQRLEVVWREPGDDADEYDRRRREHSFPKRSRQVGSRWCLTSCDAVAKDSLHLPHMMTSLVSSIPAAASCGLPPLKSDSEPDVSRDAEEADPSITTSKHVFTLILFSSVKHSEDYSER